eukprot:12798366-Alexandrium_andersonii.AAC.1
MSASLVGSEMCIRDSPHTTQIWVLEVAALRGVVPRAHLEVIDSAPQERACLLYTSDAADDM